MKKKSVKIITWIALICMLMGVIGSIVYPLFK
jgi:hypothetical protein